MIHRQPIVYIKFYAKLFIKRWPWLYFPLLHLTGSPRRHLHVRRDTEIVIEGYPRSANTFAVCAFLFAQGRSVKIARHLHAPAQIVQAAHWKIPTLVLIRQPEDAILSLLVREPLLSAKQAFREYIKIYSTIFPYPHGYVLATFEEVTQDFGEVIDGINLKFGTKFLRFEHTQENVEKVFRMVEEMDKADTGRNHVTEATVARPSGLRKKLKMQRRKEFERPEIAPLIEKAKVIYAKMLHVNR